MGHSTSYQRTCKKRAGHKESYRKWGEIFRGCTRRGTAGGLVQTRALALGAWGHHRPLHRLAAHLRLLPSAFSWLRCSSLSCLLLSLPCNHHRSYYRSALACNHCTGKLIPPQRERMRQCKTQHGTFPAFREEAIHTSQADVTAICTMMQAALQDMPRPLK